MTGPAAASSSGLGHPEVRARVTACRAALGDAQREVDDYYHGGQRPDEASLLLRIMAELRGLLGALDLAAKTAKGANVAGESSAGPLGPLDDKARGDG